MSETVDRVKKVVGEVVRLPADIQLDFKIEYLNLDSLDVVEIVYSFEDEFSVKIFEDEPVNWKTLGDIVSYIEGLVNVQG